jgi:hypothetical protein
VKIHSLRIDAFGKLRDFTADFEDGMNCIRKDNEFGKSTILAFIRAMFYGFQKRSSKEVREYGRAKYAPWNPGAYGGTISFSHNGRTYRIERIFSGRKSDDRTVLRDGLTGTAEDIGDSEIGEYLFDLGEAEFVNTFFVGQLASNLDMTDRDTGSVANRLANLAASGSEHFSFETADKNLKAAANDLSTVRGGGLIHAMEKDEEEMNALLLKAEELISEAEQTTAQAEQKMLEAEEIERSERLPLFEKIAGKEAVIKSSRTLLAELTAERIRREERAKALEDIIRKRVEQESERKRRSDRRASRITELERENAELIGVSERYGIELKRNERELESLTDRYDNDLPGLIRTRDVYKEQSERLREESDRLDEEGIAFSREAADAGADQFRKSVFLPILVSLTLLLIAAAGFVISAIVREPVFLLLTIALLPAAIPISRTAILFLRRRAENADFAAGKADYDGRLAVIRATIPEAALSERDAETAVERLTEWFRNERIRKETEMRFISERIAGADVRIRKIRDEIDLLRDEDRLENSPECINNTEEPGQANREDAEDPETELNENRRQLADIKQEENKVTEALTCAAEEAENLRAEEGRILGRIGRLREEASKLQGQAESQMSRSVNPSEIEEKKATLADRIGRAREYYRALELSSGAMSEASRAMESLFAPMVNEIAGRYLSELTGERYSALRFDKGFRVEIADAPDGVYRAADYFSAGTVDQIYLALRLAIADLIDASEDGLPVFLDDALVQYDEDRAKRAVSVLKQLSQKRQVIMFTCHKSIERLFRESGKASARTPSTDY